MPPQNQRNQNLSSDDTEAERQAKLDAAAERERKAAEEAAEEKRKADEKAAKDAEREAGKKPTAAHPQVSAGGSESAASHPEKTSQRPAETVKAGESGKGAGGRSTKLSRRDMEDVIKAGGSVMYRGQILTQLGHLPPAGDLVAGDAEAEKRVAAELDTQIEALQKQRDKLPK